MSADTFRQIGLLVPFVYDAVSIPSYDASNNPLTVRYYQGGITGTLVCTLTLTYDTNSNVSTVVRT